MDVQPGGVVRSPPPKLRFFQLQIGIALEIAQQHTLWLAYSLRYAPQPAGKALPVVDKDDLVRYGRRMDANPNEAKTKLSQLIERTVAGKEILIATADKSIAGPVRLEAASRRVLGLAKGTISYSEGWDSVRSNEEMSALLIGATSDLVPDTPAIPA